MTRSDNMKAAREAAKEAAKAARLAHGRSRVSNAARRGEIGWLNKVDPRGPIARRFKDIASLVTNDVGGVGNTSECQRQIIRRIAAISTWCESQEAEMAAGTEIDILRFGRTANSLRRLCEAIGLSRTPRDITPSLSEYLNAAYEDTEDAA